MIPWDEMNCFSTEALAGTLINLFRDKAKGDRDKTIKYLVSICKSSLLQVLLSDSEADDDKN